MNGTNVLKPILDRLAGALPDLTPEARKAAVYVLENPQDVSVLTVRELAKAAGVGQNTVMRMAQQTGFDGYDDFRSPFREAVRNGAADFPDRAQWLQDTAKSGGLGALYAETVRETLKNIEETFSQISPDQLEAAAKAIWTARRVYVLGVGINAINARNFTYLASTGMVEIEAIPRLGSTALDDLAWADERDVLLAMTCKPYRVEVVDAVRMAQEQGVRVIGLSDSPASPILRDVEHRFCVSVETQQFFPSSVGIVALLETLLSFVVAFASDEVVKRVRTFHKRRHQIGLYYSEDS